MFLGVRDCSVCCESRRGWPFLDERPGTFGCCLLRARYVSVSLCFASCWRASIRAKPSRLRPGRLNAVLVVGMFVGMAAGSALGLVLQAHWGWMAVVLLAVLSSLLAFAVRLGSGGRRA